MLKIKDVKNWVKEIGEIAIACDYENAHISEDELYESVLENIANGAKNPARLAEEALKAREIDFFRWFA
jgi:hypothetical protein